LLSSLPGAAVESVKISGVQHEFSAVEGVQEDVVEILMNLKQLSVRCFSDSPVTLSLTKKGKGVVLASDFEKNSDIEIVNPDLKILTITDDKKTVEMEITIGTGRGYVSVEEKSARNLDLGTILIDSLYTPIRDVGYKVELTRVGDVTDYEKLVLNIETNGTISPRDAVNQSTRILIDHLSLLLDNVENSSAPVKEEPVMEEIEETKEDDVEEKEVKPAKAKKVATKKAKK
jgi:DNA-directed RNA polymerase subunit alpha